MNVMDMLQKTGGLDSIAAELGVDKKTAASGAEALMPAILGGMKKSAQGTGGIGGLAGMLGSLGGGGLLDNVLSKAPTDTSRGNEILGQIFGSKEVSRTVAGNAAAKTGVDPGVLKKMLPMLAMLVSGAMAKQAGDGQPGGGMPSGGLGGLIGGLLGGGKGAKGGGGFGGLASMLDMDGDGNPLDDIMGMASRLGR